MLSVTAIAQMAVAVSFFPGLAAIAPVVVASYQMSLVQTGLLFSAIQLGPVLTVALWGVAADRKGDRFILALGLGGGALVLGTGTTLHSYPVLLGSFAVASMLTASANIASTRVAAGSFAADKRGLALGIRQMSVPLGGAAAGLLLPGLTLAEGLRGTFVTLAAICGLAAALAFATLREPGNASAGPSRNRFTVWRDRRLWRLAIGGGLLVLCQNSVLAYVVIFLTGYRHLPLQSAAMIFLATQVLGAAARVVLGRFSDQMLSRVRPMRWIAVGLAGAALTVSVSLDLPVAILAPALVLASVLSMASTGLAYAVTAEIAGLENAGAAIGFEITLFAITGTIAPVAFGFETTVFGWQGAFASIAVAAAAAWFVLQRLAALERLGWGSAHASTTLVALGQPE